MRKVKLHIRRTLKVVLGIVLSGYLVLLLALNYGPCQERMAQIAAEMLSEKVHSRVSIGTVEVGLFNRIVLNDVQIDDQRLKPLLRARRMTAKISLRSLFSGPLTIRSVSLLDGSVNLYKPAPDAPLNCQYLIDAFASHDKGPSKLNLRIGSLILRRLDIRYDAIYQPRKAKGRFDVAHIALSNLNASVSLRRLTPREIDLRVRALSFRERSGFCLAGMTLHLTADRQRARLRDFELKLSESRFRLSELEATYDVRRSLSELWPTLRVSGAVKRSALSLADVRPFVQLPAALHERVRFQTRFAVNPQRIAFDDLSLSTEDGRTLSLTGAIALKRGRSREIFREVIVRQLSLQVDAPLLAGHIRPFLRDSVAPHVLSALGKLSAELTGRLIPASLQGDGRLSLRSEAGEVRLQAAYDGAKFRTRLTLHDVNPSRLFQREALPTLVSATGSADVTIDPKALRRITGGGAHLTLERLDWARGSLRDVRLTASLVRDALAFSLVSPNRHADGRVAGTLHLSDWRLDGFDLRGTLGEFTPALWNLHDARIGGGTISGRLEARAEGLTAASPHGHLSLHDVSLKGGSHGDYALSFLDLSLKGSGADQRLELASDFLDAKLEGELDLKRLVVAGQRLIGNALPGLLSSESQQERRGGERLSIHAQLKDGSFFSRVLGLPIEVPSTVVADGTVDLSGDRTSLQVYADSLSLYGQRFGRSSVSLTGSGGEYRLLVQSRRNFKHLPMALVADLRTANGELKTDLSWGALRLEGLCYDGSLSSVTRFSRDRRGGLALTTRILPTTFTIADSLWHISSGSLHLADRRLTFDSVSVSHKDQSVLVAGAFSPAHRDSVVAELRQIDVDYILGLANFDAVKFAGRATGRGILTWAGNGPQVEAELTVPNFYFNDGLMGYASIRGGWQKADNTIRLDATMWREPGRSTDGLDVKGQVDLAHKELGLDFLARRVNLDFLNYYVGDIFDGFRGDASGHLRLYGPFKQLDFSGQMTAAAHLGIPQIGVAYDLADGTITFSPGAITFGDFKVNDGRGGTGTAAGALLHRHLKDLRYDFTVEARHLLCYDRGEGSDMPFYSTATGTGTIRVHGGAGALSAEANITTERPTTLTYQLQTAEAAGGYQFLTFRDPQKSDPAAIHKAVEDKAASKAKEEKYKGEGMDVGLDLSINVTPEARITIVTDPRSGDAVTTTGSGALRTLWHNKGGLELYGTYRVERGTYYLSLQNVIRKDLSVREGSTVTFTGVPTDALLNVDAVYHLTGVPLSDLNYRAGFSSKSARVDCLVHVGGQAGGPQVSFDLDLSGISEDEKQMVRQLIATDDDMSRQVLYLLALGRFYTAGSGTATAGQETQSSQSASAMRSLLSSTLTGQLNAALASALGTGSRWNFGTNLTPGRLGWNDLEVDGLLQGRMLNDRLIFNGSFGYRDRPYDATNFVGDFDLRYLLTPAGTVSLKAYSETTDRYFTKSSLTTQGIGIVLKRDFSNLRELFRVNRRRRAGGGATYSGN